MTIGVAQIWHNEIIGCECAEGLHTARYSYSVLISTIVIVAGRYLSVKRDMRPRITNISAITLDVHRFSFESADALGFDNEYSGFAVTPALLSGDKNSHSHPNRQQNPPFLPALRAAAAVRVRHTEALVVAPHQVRGGSSPPGSPALRAPSLRYGAITPLAATPTSHRTFPLRCHAATSTSSSGLALTEASSRSTKIGSRR